MSYINKCDVNSFLNLSPGVVINAMMQAVSALFPGAVIGPYRLLFPLGKGGMGEVWASRRVGLSGFQKTLAVKVLKDKAQTENAKVMLVKLWSSRPDSPSRCAMPASQ